MALSQLDYACLIGYSLVVLAVALWASRRRRTSEDYFLAGRKLTWAMVGLSLVGASISTEHFVRMGEKGYAGGLAYASYAWIAAAALVLVAWFLLPRFLSRGICTIPEYLEIRYSAAARGLMAFFMLAAYALVIMPAVLYAGAAWAETTLRLPLAAGIWTIGLVAGLYTLWGGLRAVVWADLLVGLSLILGGIAVVTLGFIPLGAGQGLSHGMNVFFSQSAGKLHSFKPFSHYEIPWAAVLLGGMWIVQAFSWGMNPAISQRALGAKSLAQSQKGMLLGASLQLLVPFLIILPAMMAFQLPQGGLRDPGKAYSFLALRVLPEGVRGLMFAAMLGAVLSTFDAMLGAAATVFTLDLYRRHLRPRASDRSLVGVGRVATGLLAIAACLWAPWLGWIGGQQGMFYCVERALGLVAPGIVAAFLFGLWFKRAPSQAAVGAMLLGPALGMASLWIMPEVAFLHHVGFAFVGAVVYMSLVTLLRPLEEVEARAAPGGLPPMRRPAGLVSNTLIPFFTAILGSYLLGSALFRFSWIVALQAADRWEIGETPEWIHFINAGVPALVYFAVSLWLLRRPAPAARLVGPAPALRPARRLCRSLGAWAATVLAAVVTGLHVYMFSLWILPSSPPEEYWQGYEVHLAAIGTGGAVLVEKVPQEEEPAPETEVEAPPLDAAALARLARASSNAGARPGLAQGVVTVYATPFLIAVAAAVALLVGVGLLRRVPAAPDPQPQPATHFDLAPSPWVAIWGLLVIGGVVFLYWFFL